MKMKHSLIALAVAGASSAAVVTPAQAGDVKVYGIAQVEIAAVSHQTENPACGTANKQDQTTANGCDGLDVLDNSMGRVGVKASEDLGNGMTGLAKFEFKADTADNVAGGSNVSLTGRESLVGLKGGWGQFELGNLKSAYKYAGGVKYDAFVATTLQARGNGGMTGKGKYGSTPGMSDISAYGHNGFLKEMAAYQWGGKGGFSFRITYGLKDGAGDYSANAMFKQDKWEIFLAAVDTGDRGKGADNESYSAIKAGGALKFGAHKFMLQYEQSTFSDDVNQDVEPTHIYAAWNMKMGKIKWVINYGMYDADAQGSPNDDTTYAALGLFYNFTKTTSVFGGYRMSDADNDSREDVVSIGLKKKF